MDQQELDAVEEDFASIPLVNRELFLDSCELPCQELAMPFENMHNALRWRPIAVKERIDRVSL